MRTLTCLAFAFGLLMLTACASNGGSSLARSEAKDTDIDSRYVSRVDALARDRGVDVIWVNPPRVKDRRIASR